MEIGVGAGLDPSPEVPCGFEGARPVGFTPISIDAATTTMKKEWGLPDAMVDWLSSLNQIVSAGYAAGISPDVATLLGRAPITFAQFAQNHAPSWR